MTTPATGRKYAVHITPEAGSAVIQPKRTGTSPRRPRRDEPLPATLKSSIRQSVSRLKKFAVARRLHLCITLTYRDIPDHPDEDLSDYLAAIKDHYPEPFDWAAVTESGETGEHRPHHHVLLPLHRSPLKIASNWIHGDLHVGINPTSDDIRRTINYLKRHFKTPSPHKKRFRRSQHRTPKTHTTYTDTLEQAHNIIHQHLPPNTRTTTYDPHCGHRTITYWNPIPPPAS
jgi:hypothetical protein